MSRWHYFKIEMIQIYCDIKCGIWNGPIGACIVYRIKMYVNKWYIGEIYQFNTNGNWSHDKKQNIGEYNLFNLPHYDEYDGIIFDCTNMTDQDQLELIIEKLKNLDIPVVSIGYYVDGLYYVGNDNKKLFRLRRKICCTQNREYRACERSNSVGNKAWFTTNYRTRKKLSTFWRKN